MIVSMTGFGRAQRSRDRLAVTAEVRAVNNRHLRVSARCSETHASLEPLVEQLVRSRISRGSIQVTVTVEREPSPDDYTVNLVALEAYLKQLQPLVQRTRASLSLDHILTLPGVVTEAAGAKHDPQQDWQVIEEAVTEALDKLQRMRREEGQAMAEELARCCQTIREHLAEIEQLAGQVADSYRARLLERLRATLEELDIRLDESAVIREVAIFA